MCVCVYISEINTPSKFYLIPCVYHLTLVVSAESGILMVTGAAVTSSVDFCVQAHTHIITHGIFKL